MCGIAGIISIGDDQPPIDVDVLDLMTDSMIHRGPDGRGVWLSDDRRVGLGHRRLSIIDLSPLGAQPMPNEDGKVWVTFNGEIYNYQILRETLEKKGHVFRSKSDTEVLVHLYEEFGEGMVNHLDGDFAYAIWDVNNKKLCLARDPIGVKPLYYSWAGPYFVFASELKALLKHPEIERTIDKEGLYHYLTYLAVPAPFSLIKGVKKLRAGESVTLDLSGNLNFTQYWEPLPGQCEIQTGRLDEQLEDLLFKSVRKRLISDVPVGVMFSGGVDSSLNALLFKDIIRPEKVHTYNLWMREPRYHDESYIAEQVSKCVGTDHHAMQFDLKSFLDGLSESDYLTFYQDEPLADPAALSVYFVSKLARETGRVVLQAGEGADEIFCGYDGYRNWLKREEKFWQPLCKFPKGAGSLGYKMIRHLDHPFSKKIADVLRRRGLGQEFFMSEAVGYYEHEKAPILSRSFKADAGRLDSFSLVQPYYERIRSAIPNPSFLQVMSYIELSLRLPELLLMRADKMSMANSIELRVPFLDRELVEFALSVPESFKLRDGISKEPLKRLASRRLASSLEHPIPTALGASAKDVFYRTKTGFGAPIEDWLDSKLSKDLLEIIDEDKKDLEQYFDLDHVREMIRHGMVSVNRSYQIWALYSFILWKRCYGL